MRSRLAAGEDGGVDRLDADDFEARLLLLEIPAGAGDGAAGPDARDENVDGARGVVPDFRAGARAMNGRVGRVRELAGQRGARRVRNDLGGFLDRSAAVLAPVGKVWLDGAWHHFHDNGQSVGPIMQKVYDLLVGIQRGEIVDENNWTHEVRID